MKAKLPKVSCFCCTYGRPHLLEEAVESFLRQDYKGPKELIVLNDFAEQTLIFEHSEVFIINADERIKPLGRKFNEAVGYCSGEVILPWEDDDIYLPWRIRVSVERMQRGLFHTHQAWLDNLTGELSYSENLYQCNLAVQSSLWHRAGGYKEQDISAIDLDLFEKLHGYERTQKISLEDIFYIYRWAGSQSYHGSEIGGEVEGISDVASSYVQQQMATGALQLGDVYLHPQWRTNWLALVQQAIEKTQNPLAQLTQFDALFPIARFYPLGQKGFAVSLDGSELFELNIFASFVWLKRGEGVFWATILQQLQEKYPLQKEKLVADLLSLLADWQSCGLWANREESDFFQLGHQLFQIASPDQTFRKALRGLLSPLTVEARSEIDTYLKIQHENNVLAVYENGQKRFEGYADTLMLEILDLFQQKAEASLQGASDQTCSALSCSALSVGEDLIVLLSDKPEQACQLAVAVAKRLSGSELLTSDKVYLDEQLVRFIASPVRLSSPQCQPLLTDYPDILQTPVLMDKAQTQVRAKHYFWLENQSLEMAFSPQRTFVLSVAQSLQASLEAIEINDISGKMFDHFWQGEMEAFLAFMQDVTPYQLNFSNFEETTQNLVSAIASQQLQEKQSASLPEHYQSPTYHRLVAESEQANNEQALKLWVKQSLASGIGRAQLYRALLEQGYSMALASRVMGGFQPKLNLAPIKEATLRSDQQTPLSVYFAFTQIELTIQPSALQLAHDYLQLFEWQQFLEERLLKLLKGLAKRHFETAPLWNNAGLSSPKALLSDLDQSIDQTLRRILSDRMGMDVRYFQSIELQCLLPGMKTDSVILTEQTSWAGLIFLSDDFEGGALSFVNGDIQIEAEANKAVFWNCLTPLGKHLSMADMHHHSHQNALKNVLFFKSKHYLESTN